MARIEKLSEDQDESGTLARVYSASKSRSGEVAQILQVMSPRPDLVEKFIDLYVQLMQHSSGLVSGREGVGGGSDQPAQRLSLLNRVSSARSRIPAGQ